MTAPFRLPSSLFDQREKAHLTPHFISHTYWFGIFMIFIISLIAPALQQSIHILELLLKSFQWNETWNWCKFKRQKKKNCWKMWQKLTQSWKKKIKPHTKTNWKKCANERERERNVETRKSVYRLISIDRIVRYVINLCVFCSMLFCLLISILCAHRFRNLSQHCWSIAVSHGFFFFNQVLRLLNLIIPLVWIEIERIERLVCWTKPNNAIKSISFKRIR